MKNFCVRRGLIFTALILALAGGTAFFTPELEADRLYFDQSLPGRCEVTPDYSIEKDYALTKEEAAGCRDKMEKLIKIFKETGPLAAPKGFYASLRPGYVTPGNRYQQILPPYMNHRVQMQLYTRLNGLYLVNGKPVPQEEPPVFKGVRSF